MEPAVIADQPQARTRRTRQPWPSLVTYSQLPKSRNARDPVLAGPTVAWSREACGQRRAARLPAWRRANQRAAASGKKSCRRFNWRRKITWPAASTPCTWKTDSRYLDRLSKLTA